MNKRTKSNTIRIISGQWRGRRLPVLDHDGLRPSTDRVRETLFNWLMHDVSGARCLDLFAGSGVLGLESLSRGAEKAIFVEDNKRVAKQIEQNLRALEASERAEVINMSALKVVRDSASEPFDLVFLDPPFESDLLAQVMPMLSNNGWLAEGALIYVEQASKKDPQETPGWKIYKEGKAGYSQYALYTI